MMLNFTKSELEVMNVLWQAHRPLSRNEILTLSTNKTWKDSSIHILLNGLLKKEAIKEAGHVRTGKTFGRLYVATISCEEYFATNVFALRGKVILPLLSTMINSGSLSNDMVRKIAEMIEKRKKQLV